MQHGMHNTMELQRVESELRDSELKSPHLLVDHRLRHRQPSRLATLAASLRTLLAPRPVLREERGV